MSRIYLKSVGSDPEFFIFNKGLPVSSVGMIPGSKAKPFKITDHEAVQVDNVALEFNVKPSKSAEEFIESLERCYHWASKHLASIDKGLYLSPTASVIFPPEELKTRAAKRFGCEPDFNAWEMGGVNAMPRSVDGLRSCGGHIHLGLDADGDMDVDRLIRLMDKYVGIYTSNVCGDDRRRLLYGKAGAYRMKPYGVEYRTPSISWIKSNDTIVKVFSLIKEAVLAYNLGEDADVAVMFQINEPSIRKESVFI